MILATHIFITAYWALSGLALICALSGIGILPFVLLRICDSRTAWSLSLVPALGFFELTVVSWLFYDFNFSSHLAFASIIGANGVAIAAALFHPRIRAIADELLIAAIHAWPVLLICLVATGVGAALLTAPLAADDFSLVTVGNADIHMYVKAADFLLNFSGDQGNIANFDLRKAANVDVFGAFETLAFSAFLYGKNPIDMAFTPLVAACGLVAALTTALCRSAFRIPWIIADTFGLLTVCNQLFSYLMFNYFLSQLLESALLLTFIITALTPIASKRSLLLVLAVAGFLFLYTTLFSYPMLFWPSVFLFFSLAFWRSVCSSIDGKPWPSSFTLTVAAPAVSLGLTLAICLVLLTVASRRVSWATWEFFHYSKPGIVGWPLGMISPLSLLGIPVAWHDTFDRTTIAEMLAATLLILLAITLVVRMHIGFRALTVIFLSAASFFVYFAIFAKYGRSYNQWKFASSYPLIFGFGIGATFVSGVLRSLRERHRHFGAVTVLVIMICLVGANLYRSARNWVPTAVTFPRRLAAMSAIDQMPEIGGVLIELEDYQLRMLAAALIRKKSISFIGVTYYGPGVGRPYAVSLVNPILRDRSTCPAADPHPLKDLGGGMILTNVVDAALISGWHTSISSHGVNCFTTYGGVLAAGWSQPDDRGVWTDGPTAQLLLPIYRNAFPDGAIVEFDFDSFIIEERQQRLEISIGKNVIASAIFEKSHLSRKIEVMLKPDDLNMNLPITLGLSLPDAISPAELGISNDPRKLGVMLMGIGVVAP